MNELDWTHAVASIRDQRRVERTATARECAAISKLIGDDTCETLAVNYEIVPLGPGRYRVHGRLQAIVLQVCGVTLEPIRQHIDEGFDIEFRSGSKALDQTEIDIDPLAEDDPEPIERGEIHVGRLIGELIVSHLDPFPRAPDAQLDQTEAGQGSPADTPFSALSRLRSGE